VWTVSFLGTYRIIEWNPVTKARSRTLVRRGDGFASKQEFAALSPKTPPSPPSRASIATVRTSGCSTRWRIDSGLCGLVQAEMQTHSGKAKYWKPEQPDLVFDTIVEAIDIATGKLLASQKFDEAYIAVTSTREPCLHRGETTEGRAAEPAREFRGQEVTITSGALGVQRALEGLGRRERPGS
jgi:hypothetical protein